MKNSEYIVNFLKFLRDIMKGVKRNMTEQKMKQINTWVSKTDTRGS